jgi:hypothetical protein
MRFSPFAGCFALSEDRLLTVLANLHRPHNSYPDPNPRVSPRFVPEDQFIHGDQRVPFSMQYQLWQGNIDAEPSHGFLGKNTDTSEEIQQKEKGKNITPQFSSP